MKIAIELESLFEDYKYFQSLLDNCDKAAFICASLMLLGVLSPWISAKGYFTQLGLMGGGDIHFILAIITIARIHRVIKYRLDLSLQSYRYSLDKALLRVSLSYIFIGLGSILASIIFLVFFGTQHATIEKFVDVRFGFYITLVSGCGILAAGLRRFI